MLEGDEESSGSEGPFHNDRIRIEVEIGDSPFVDEDAVAPKTYAVEGERGDCSHTSVCGSQTKRRDPEARQDLAC
ncbi:MULTISPECIES: hypothetical protein [unclassified Mesorhizobium]|uniref:hypothetical protein n=1 Tax=unclassified Mesorhizobium TaxID=325217 RepID=UPI00333BD747